MRTYFTLLLLAAASSFLMTPLARRLAFAIGAVDRPDPRKIHREPTARLGGFAVVVGFCVPWLALYLLDNRISQVLRDHDQLIGSLFVAGLVMFVIGAIDDILGLAAKTKLVFQILVAIGMFAGGFRITTLSTPFVGTYHLGWLSLPVTVLWIVALTNATNLLDGMDGLVAGVAAVLALSLAMINIIGGNIIVALLTFCLAGATLGFLPYNFAPARIFLGDSGSLFLGVIMAGISTVSFFKAATASLVFIPLLLFALPLFDTTQVVIGRLRRGQHPFSPDKTHVHHRLLDFGLTQKQAAGFLYVITGFLGVSAIVLSWKSNPASFLGIAAIAVVLLVAMISIWARIRAPRTPPPDPVPVDRA